MVVVTFVHLSASGNAGLSYAGHPSVACLLDLRAPNRVSPLYDVVAYPLCLLQIAVLTNARKAYAFVGHNNARQMHQLIRRLWQKHWALGLARQHVIPWHLREARSNRQRAGRKNTHAYQPTTAQDWGRTSQSMQPRFCSTYLSQVLLHGEDQTSS